MKPKRRKSLVLVRGQDRAILNFAEGYLCSLKHGEYTIQPFSDFRHLTPALIERAYRFWGYVPEKQAKASAIVRPDRRTPQRSGGRSGENRGKRRVAGKDRPCAHPGCEEPRLLYGDGAKARRFCREHYNAAKRERYQSKPTSARGRQGPRDGEDRLIRRVNVGPQGRTRVDVVETAQDAA